jgi:DNA-binding transcriptional regulator/RsmH inhibitor MraZ
VVVSETVEHLDERGRVTVKLPYRELLKEGYIQVLTPDGVLFRRVSRRPLRTRAPALDDVDADAMKDV